MLYFKEIILLLPYLFVLVEIATIYEVIRKTFIVKAVCAIP